MAMYLYLTKAKIDTIILLNHFGFFVLYSLLLRKLRDIKTYNAIFIKWYTTNYKLVSL